MLLFNSVLLLILLCVKNSQCMLVMKTAEDLDEVRIRILDDAADHQALLGQAEQDLDKVLKPADGEHTYESGFRVRKATYNRICLSLICLNPRV